MARFCTKCGAAASEQVKFCAKCGAALPAPSTTSAAPPPTTAQASPPVAPPVTPAASVPTAAAPAKSSGPWMKIILAVLGFFVVLSVLGIATCVYIGYRVKQKVEQAKTEYGLDKLSNLPSTPSGSSTAQARDVCSLLTKEEVSDITGVTITEAQGTKEQCTYASATNPTVVQDNVTWEGGAMAFKITAGVTKFGAAGAPVIEKIPGIGDEAISMTPFQGKDKESFQHDMKDDKSGMLKGMANMIGQFPLMFRKGDVMVSVGVSEARGDNDDAKKALAAKIASRL
jgi:hypothetical protein